MMLITRKPGHKCLGLAVDEGIGCSFIQLNHTPVRIVCPSRRATGWTVNAQSSTVWGHSPTDHTVLVCLGKPWSSQATQFQESHYDASFDDQASSNGVPNSLLLSIQPHVGRRRTPVHALAGRMSDSQEKSIIKPPFDVSCCRCRGSGVSYRAVGGEASFVLFIETGVQGLAPAWQVAFYATNSEESKGRSSRA